MLRLPDLDHCKLAVLNSPGSPASRHVYEYAIDQFVAWYCSEPRLAFNRIVANQINEPADLWDLEHHLTQRRKDIERKYDYRYSQLTHVFGRLLHEQRLCEEELRGLREDKLKSIRSFARFLAEDAVA